MKKTFDVLNRSVKVSCAGGHPASGLDKTQEGVDGTEVIVVCWNRGNGKRLVGCRLTALLPKQYLRLFTRREAQRSCRYSNSNVHLVSVFGF